MIHPIGVIRRGEQSFVRTRLKQYSLVPVEAFALHLIAVLGCCNQDTLCTRLEIDKAASPSCWLASRRTARSSAR